MGNQGGSIHSDTSSRFAKKTTEHHSDQFSYAVSHMKGWREYMEDACIHIEHFPNQNHHLFAVLDGHGGPEVAQYVQRHFPMQFALNPHIATGDFGQALIDTFHSMDDLLRTTTGRQELLSIIRHNVTLGNRQAYWEQSQQLAGCTANVCLLSPEHVFVANAGDSRSVACCRGHPVPLSYDHKPDDRAEYRRIRKAGGFVHNGRINHTLNMSRSLGDLQFKGNGKLGISQQMITSTPDVIGCKREGLQFILMGCDGVWQRKTNQKMVQWIKKRVLAKIGPGKILQQLFDDQLAEDEDGCFGTDNMSAILILFHN